MTYLQSVLHLNFFGSEIHFHCDYFELFNSKQIFPESDSWGWTGGFELPASCTFYYQFLPLP